MPELDPLEVPERVFQAQIMRLAAMFGWHVAHFRPSQTRDGKWLTAISGDPGFPDLVLAHPERGIVFAELKTASGRVAPAQAQWLDKLNAARLRAVRVHLWRPADLDDIAALLSAPISRPPVTPAPSPSTAEAAAARKTLDTPPGRARPSRGRK